MRYMMVLKMDPASDGVPPTPELSAAMGTLMKDMTQAGVLVDAGGLTPSAQGARVRASAGKVTLKEGPFTETKELIGGYAILQCRSRAEAFEHARRFMSVHAEVLGPSYAGEIEIRQLIEGPGK